MIDNSRATPTSRARSAMRAHRRRMQPAPLDRILVAAAVVGVLVSLFLAVVDLTGASTLCLTGPDCDAVRGSIYGKVVGVPLAVFGAAYFGGVLALGLARSPRLAGALPVAGGVGLASASIFVGLQGVVLGAWCPYCLVADAAALVVAVRTLLPSPGPSLLREAGGAALSVAVLVGGYAVAPGAPVQQPSDELTALAAHLTDSGAKFYGAYWCPHCQNQKKLFGAAAGKLPYVECDQRGTNAQPAACDAAGVKAYPTWVINGERREGEVSIADLKRLSRFGS